MTFNPQQGQMHEQGQWAGHNTRRRSGRLTTESIASNLGPVLNLSQGGMQILCSRVPKGRITIELMGCEMHVKVQGEVAWVQRVGLFRKIVGIHFVDVAPEIAAKLTSMAMTNTVRRRIA